MAAAPTARARDGCQPHDRVAAPARSAHRTGPDRRGEVVAGGRGIDIDQGQVRAVSTGRRDDIRRDDVGSTIAAAGGGHHLGPRSLRGARRQVEDQDQAGAGRDDEPSAIADLPVAAWDTELTWPVTHQERVSLHRCLKKKIRALAAQGTQRSSTRSFECIPLTWLTKRLERSVGPMVVLFFPILEQMCGLRSIFLTATEPIFLGEFTIFSI